MKDIDQNSHRVYIILKRLEDAEGEEPLSFKVKQLALEELLSKEHYLELDNAARQLDSSRIFDIIKVTTVGQGIKFLPRKLNGLVKGL